MVKIVKARSVKDYLNKFHKKSRMTPTLLGCYQKIYKEKGYICTSRHDNVTGEFIAWPYYPSIKEELERRSQNEKSNSIKNKR